MVRVRVMLLTGLVINKDRELPFLMMPRIVQLVDCDYKGTV